MVYDESGVTSLANYWGPMRAGCAKDSKEGEEGGPRSIKRKRRKLD